MSGSQACRGSPHGPFEKEMSFEGREKLTIMNVKPSQILFHCFVC